MEFQRELAFSAHLLFKHFCIIDQFLGEALLLVDARATEDLNLCTGIG
jgi:hypothetical protein